MTKRTIAALVVALATTQATTQAQVKMEMAYDRPARYFEESLPIGNGKLGALVYGGVDDNTIYLNDITLWTGKPVDRQLDANAHEWIPKIRQALFSEDYQLADSLQLHVQGPNSQFFQPLATLHIDHLNAGATTAYRRWLSLDSAIVADSYTLADGSTVRREYFASAPDRLIAISISGKNMSLRLRLTAQTPHKARASLATPNTAAITCPPTPRLAAGQVTMTGHAMGDPQQSIHYCTMLKATTDGAVEAADSTVTIEGASHATIYIVSQTSFNGFDRHPVSQGAAYLDNANTDMWHTENLPYQQLRQRHTDDYRSFYSRLSLRLGTEDQQPRRTTDEMLKAYSGFLDGTTLTPAEARYLETLYFQYGRYLLISASRTPGVPANLQGLWTPHLWSPWRGNYTVNINLEENYWPAFNTNLAEMAQPLDDFIQALAANGAFTAKSYYGIGRGWCSSHNSDIWAMTNPVGEKNEKPEWANWNLGGAWLVNTLWERFLYTQDHHYLEQVAWPLMKGAAQFCLDWLVDNPKAPGELITAPSTSPENEYKTPDGYHGMTCYGGTADLAIIRELLTNATTAATLCHDDPTPYRQALSRLHPYTVGHKGDLNEWYYDWDDWDPTHRHQSHLIGLYPGQHITLADSLLAKACEQTLIQKGDHTTGWSTGWRINLWARLHKAQQAYSIVRRLLTFVTPDAYDGPDKHRSGGTYPNLMDAHPPFQIDGNFGGTAGFCEMLMQSSCDIAADGLEASVTLLPALPQEWADGEVSGLRARGGYELSFAWSGGRVTRCTVTATTDSQLTLSYNGQQHKLRLKAGESRTL